MNIRLGSAARIEFIEAFVWYLEKSLETANAFELEMEASFFELAAFPNLPQVVLRKRNLSIRKFLIKSFPYVLYYTEHPQGTILILAIAHGKREPGYWMERIPDNDSD